MSRSAFGCVPWWWSDRASTISMAIQRTSSLTGSLARSTLQPSPRHERMHGHRARLAPASDISALVAKCAGDGLINRRRRTTTRDCSHRDVPERSKH